MGAPRKYTINEDYFEEINSEDKAYWLGFIYADGFITKRQKGYGQNILGITLADKDHLEKFANSVGTNKPVKTYVKKNSFGKKEGTSLEYKIALISNKIVSDIERWGVVENKTFLLSQIPNIPRLYIRDFIRGYFDGDGSVFYTNNKTERLTKGGKKVYKRIGIGITICGTNKFLNSLINEFDFLSKDEKCIYKDLRKETDTWKIQFLSNKRCESFYNYIYGNNPKIYMDRKLKKFTDFISNKKRSKNYSKDEITNILNFYTKYRSPKKTMKEFGFKSKSALYYFLKTYA